MESREKIRKQKRKKEIILVWSIVTFVMLLALVIIFLLHYLSKKSKTVSELDSSLHTEKEFEQIQDEGLNQISEEYINYVASFLDHRSQNELKIQLNELQNKNELNLESFHKLVMECSKEDEKPIVLKDLFVLDCTLEDEIAYLAKDEDGFYSILHLDCDYNQLENDSMDPFVSSLKVGDKVSLLTDGSHVILHLNASSCGFTLPSVWILDQSEDSITFDLNGEEFSFEKEPGIIAEYQNAAKISVKDNRVFEISPYTNKISGKLYSVRREDHKIAFEIDDKVYYGNERDLIVYQLYGIISRIAPEDLAIGYAYADFILDEKEAVIAAIKTSDEAMQSIRVVLKDSNFDSYFHELVSISCDSDFELIAGQDTKTIEKGTVLDINPDSELFVTNRIIFKPKTNTGQFKIHSLNRSQGVPSYRGILEIEKTKDGILIVNEILLDEYLYSVVPSEMPSSYPKEALKAQAISARTYAYMHMMHAGMGKYGAHVDDSTAFQVYNNCQETRSTTEAVCETQNELLTYDGKPVSTYFYSTSCGQGTDLSAWKYKEGQFCDEDMIYLKSMVFSSSVTEECTDFDTFIRSFPKEYYESNETYFRWKYQSEFDSEIFYKTLKECFEANPQTVLTLVDDDYCSKEIKDDSKIKSMEIVERGPGNVATKLAVETQKNNYLVLTEKNIRTVLVGSSTEIGLSDQYQKEGSVGKLLPSAFCVIETEENKLGVTSYTVYGGGYGHGIGMSQNGAKDMANVGINYREILQKSYLGTEIVKFDVLK